MDKAWKPSVLYVSGSAASAFPNVSFWWLLYETEELYITFRSIMVIEGAQEILLVPSVVRRQWQYSVVEQKAC
jgi:hypothetical protein